MPEAGGHNPMMVLAEGPGSLINDDNIDHSSDDCFKYMMNDLSWPSLDFRLYDNEYEDVREHNLTTVLAEGPSSLINDDNIEHSSGDCFKYMLNKPSWLSPYSRLFDELENVKAPWVFWNQDSIESELFQTLSTCTPNSVLEIPAYNSVIKEDQISALRHNNPWLQ